MSYNNKNNLLIENIANKVYLKLLNEFHDIEQDIASKLKYKEDNPESWIAYNDLYEVLKKEGYSIIGSGHSRVVFSKSDVPFVVKLAAYPDSGINANRSEIKFCTKKDSSNQVSNILPELYSYSNNDDPWWLICEKVTPIKESSIENLIKTFPTLYYFISKKTLDDGRIVKRNVYKHEFLSLIENVFYNIAMSTNMSMKKALGIIKRDCYIRYVEEYDLNSIMNTLPLIDIQRFIESTSYDYTMDLHKSNLGIRNEKTITPNSFFILDFDSNSGGSKKIIRHIFDSNPEHKSNPSHDAKHVRNINEPEIPDWSDLL